MEARLREIDGLLQQQSGLAGQLTEGLSAGLEQLSARFAALENDGGARNQRLGDATSALTQEAERMEHALASGNVAADGLISRAEALLLALDSGARELDETLPMSLSRLDERFDKTMRRSVEHTSELQSLMRTSYAVFCLKKNNTATHLVTPTTT